jgi:tetratricopeptide (TPR) repeat protein
VGYSGENDPVFDHLANVDNFDYGLFWVGYKDAIPTSHVKSKLLDPKKNAEFISKHDADSFFVELAQKLGCFPPKFVADPFGHLEFLLKDLTEFEVAQGDAKFDVMESPRWQIDQAKSLYKSSASSDMSIPEIAAMPLFMAGHYEQVIALLRTVPKLSDQSRDSMSWSYTMLGIALSDQAGAKSGDEADKLWEAVGENYQQAIDIEPDRYEAPLNWGNALYSQALNKSGFEANELFEASSEKYQQALDIKPDFNLARRSWGGALLAQAKMKSDAEKAELIGKAIKALKPSDDFDTEITSYNLACAYALLGDSKTTKHYLLAAKKTENLPDREHLESDNDMDLVRNRKWFKDMIAEL